MTGGQDGLLRQVADRDAAGAHDRAARLGAELPVDQLEQGGFASAVGADQPDLLVVLDLPGEAGEDGFGAEDEGEVGEADGDHRGGWYLRKSANHKGTKDTKEHEGF